MPRHRLFSTILACLSLFFIHCLPVSSSAFADDADDSAAHQARPLEITNATADQYGGIQLHFSEDLGCTPDKSLIEITPPVKPDFVLAWGSYISLHGEFEPGHYYQVKLMPGFPGAKAEKKTEVAQYATVVFPDRDAWFNLASSGVFYPLHSPYWELPVNSVNLADKLYCEVGEAYPSTLLNYLSSGSSRYVRQIRRSDITPKNAVRNRSQITAIDLADAGIPRGRPGVYQLRLSSRHRNDDAMVVVTDLAIMLSKVDGEYVCNVRSLAHPEQPVSGATVAVYSYKQQLLAHRTTGLDGEARFSLPEPGDRDDYAELLLVTNPADGDIAYLNIYDNGSERPAMQNPRIAAFTDRQICRPGETIRGVAVLRNRANDAPCAGMPLEAVLSGPADAKTIKPVVTDGFGVAQVQFELAAESLLGGWSIGFRLPGSDVFLGSAPFQVAQFMPDQINVTLSGAMAGARMVQARGNASYYFGQAVANGRVRLEMKCSHEPLKLPSDWRGYSFGWNRGQQDQLAGETAVASTDDAGDFRGDFALADLASVEAFRRLPVRIAIEAEVTGGGGTRPVTARASLLHHPVPWYLGAKELSTDRHAIELQFKAVDPAGNPVALPADALQYRLVRKDWNYLLRAMGDGTRRRVWEEVEEEAGRGALALSADGVARIPYSLSGHYVVEVTGQDGKQRLWSNDVWCWAGEDETRSANPNVLSFATDAERYLPGQTARLSFDCGFDGMAWMVAGGGSTPPQSRAFAVRRGENSIEVKIPAGLTRSSYFVQICAAGPIGPGFDPARSADPPFVSGVAALKIDQRLHLLNVDLELPRGGVARPGSAGEVVVKVTDHRGQALTDGEVILWGVDEGVLALCGTATPNPFDALFGKDEPPFQLSHSYRSLFPILRVVNGAIGGGDMLGKAKMAALMADMHGRRRTEVIPPAVVHIGVVALDGDGAARASFNYPQMSGSLRIMAVAVGREAVGAGEKNAVVRDPVTVSALSSAFAAPGDRLTVRGSVFNHSEAAGQFDLCWKVEQGAISDATAMESKVQIPAGSQGGARISFAIPEEGAGDTLRLTLVATAGDGVQYRGSTVIDLRPAVSPRPVVQTVVVPPGGVHEASLSAAPGDRMLIGSPAIRLQRHLDWLNGYPYGCLEQVTATAFPQLAVPALIRLGVLPEAFRQSAQQKVAQAVRQIEAMRCHDGFYAMWPQGRQSWRDGSIFAMLFQAEAHAAGMAAMSPAGMQRLTMTLRKFINRRQGRMPYTTDYALAVYALALLAPEVGGQYAHLLPVNEDNCPPFVKFLGAMALIRGGYAAEGSQLWEGIRNAQFTMQCPDDDSVLDSQVRRTGLALWILGGILPDDPAIGKLSADLDALCGGDEPQWFTTQQHAWAALGLARSSMIAHKDSSGVQARLQAKIECGGQSTQWQAPERGYSPHVVTAAGKYVITNTGDLPLYVTRHHRVAEMPPEPLASGFTIKREFLGRDGKPVAAFKVGDLLTVQITVAAESDCENAVITDLLPAGMEIEDPSLLTRASVRENAKPKDGARELSGARLIEREHDRLLWFGKLYRSQGEGVFRYQVRCLAPGKSRVPPVQVEDMYNPRRCAITPADPAIIEIAE